MKTIGLEKHYQYAETTKYIAGDMQGGWGDKYIGGWREALGLFLKVTK